MHHCLRTFATLVFLLCSGSAFAQGTITDAPASFVRTASSFDGSPDGNFTGVSATLVQDHLFEVGWWYRVSTDTQEILFGTPTTQNYAANTSTLSWTDVGTRGLFSAQEVSTVTNLGGPSGRVVMTMTITNLSAVNPLVINVFNMLDFDVQPTASNDSATELGPSRIGLTDPGGATAEYSGVGADNYLVRPFGATDLGTVLSNTSVDNFNNTGLPFGPGDFTAGMQWASRTIAPSASASFVVQFSVNANTVPVALQSYSID